MTRLTTFSFNVDSSRMMRAIETPDDIGAVIRIHFEIDRALTHVVERSVPDASELRLQYPDQRIRLLLALGVPAVRLEPVRIVNKVRNSFAHKEGKERILDEDVSELEAATCRLLGKKKIPSHFALVKKSDGSEKVWVHSEMSGKEKFCLSGFFALTGVATIENDFGTAGFKGAGRDAPVAVRRIG